MGSLSDRNFAEIERRVEHGEPVHGFMLDMAARVHPLEYLELRGSNISELMGEGNEEYAKELTEVVSEKAWPDLTFCNTVAPLPYSMDIPSKLYRPTLLLDNTSMSKIVSVMELINRRQHAKSEVMFGATSRFISQELYDGTADELTTPKVVGSWFEYMQNRGIERSIYDFEEIYNGSTHPEVSTKQPKIIIAIPVACGQERETLPRTLELLADQSLDKDDYQICVLHNIKLPSFAYSELDKELEELDDLHEKFNSFMDNMHEGEKVYFEHVYNEIAAKYPGIRIDARIAVLDEFVSIGLIRAILHADIAGKYTKQKWNNNPLVLNLDADVTSLNRNFLTEMIATQHATKKPVVVSRLKWGGTENLEPTSLVARFLRYERFLSKVVESAQGIPSFTDCGTAFALKDYCLAGGHFAWDRFYENGHIVNTINRYGKSEENGNKVALSSRSVHGSDPRRQIDVMARGHISLRAWDKGITTFGDEDDQVRTQPKPLEAAQGNLEDNLESWLMETTKVFMGEPDSELFKTKVEVIRKGLKILGFPDIFIPEVVK